MVDHEGEGGMVDHEGEESDMVDHVGGRRVTRWIKREE